MAARLATATATAAAESDGEVEGMAAAMRKMKKQRPCCDECSRD